MIAPASPFSPARELAAAARRHTLAAHEVVLDRLGGVHRPESRPDIDVAEAAEYAAATRAVDTTDVGRWASLAEGWAKLGGPILAASSLSKLPDVNAIEDRWHRLCRRMPTDIADGRYRVEVYGCDGDVFVEVAGGEAVCLSMVASLATLASASMSPLLDAVERLTGRWYRIGAWSGSDRQGSPFRDVCADLFPVTQPTHRITFTPSTSASATSVLVYLDDRGGEGAAYNREEWSLDESSSWELRGGLWLHEGKSTPGGVNGVVVVEEL